MELVKYPDPFLRKKTNKVIDFDGGLWSFAEKMIEFMTKLDGVGLAAPQVGSSLRMFVMKYGIDDIGGINKPQAFCNPSITISKVKELESETEKCLSIPGVEGIVARPRLIHFYYTNIYGKTQSVKVNGFIARIIQHEIDHLNGVLFIDRMSKKNLNLIKDKL